MSNPIADFWDSMYKQPEYAFGTQPNVYFAEKLNQLKSEKILLIGEGEGRNAVYAAINGWDVTACDLSQAGKEKANQLAAQNNVTINYIVGDFGTIEFAPKQFDAVALIYAHFPKQIQKKYIDKAIGLIRPQGHIIIEGFSLDNLSFRVTNPQIGGPSDPAMLYTINLINEWFTQFDHIEKKQTVTTLNEGLYHVGEGSVIRFLGKKK